jgi:hypothetical protein
MGQLNSRARRHAGPVGSYTMGENPRGCDAAFQLRNDCAILALKMTVKTKSIMRRRVNRARPSGLV